MRFLLLTILMSQSFVTQAHETCGLSGTLRERIKSCSETSRFHKTKFLEVVSRDENGKETLIDHSTALLWSPVLKGPMKLGEAKKQCKMLADKMPGLELEWKVPSRKNVMDLELDEKEVLFNVNFNHLSSFLTSTHYFFSPGSLRFGGVQVMEAFEGAYYLVNEAPGVEAQVRCVSNSKLLPEEKVEKVGFINKNEKLKVCGVKGSVDARAQDCYYWNSAEKDYLKNPQQQLVSKTAEGYEVWRDLKTNKVWSNVFDTLVSYHAAKSICTKRLDKMGSSKLKWRVPRLEELQEVYVSQHGPLKYTTTQQGINQIIGSDQSQAVWTSSSKFLGLKYYFMKDRGAFFYRGINSASLVVQCVADLD